jgi:phosphomannomutase
MNKNAQNLEHLDFPKFGVTFNQINRDLITAETPEQWEPAIATMSEFLDVLDQKLISNKEIIAQDHANSSRAFSMLLTLIALGTQYRLEQFKPKNEAGQKQRDLIDSEYIPSTSTLRQKAIYLAKKYLHALVFDSLQEAIKYELIPLLDSMDYEKDPARWMPFRVIQIGNIYERLYGFRLRTQEPLLIGDDQSLGLLRMIYDRKYLRFGTSGVRGRWDADFTERRARQVVQAVCDYLNDVDVPDFVGGENLAGRRIIIGYDARRNADTVAKWTAEVCLANGFEVDFASRDTPTPALVYYLTDYLSPDDVAGLLICTASHNPPEWQGIKFNPRLGYPAPTNVTDFLAFHINELQLIGEDARATDLADARKRGLLRGFDPLDDYVDWIKNNGSGNARIPVDFDRIQQFFCDKKVVIDEFHGSGRGYLTRLVGEAGVRYTVIHAQRDPELTGLDYANPEEPFINSLKEKVAETGAHLGMGMDTDADRFGIVDKGGVYFRPNQILPMLVRYLGIERGLRGRVIATQTGSPLIEILAGKIPDNKENEPAEDALPGYVSHPFYKIRIGTREDRILKHAFLVPVGIKYIEEIRRTNRAYESEKPLPENWRDRILIGGEESSGLTTRGHITDKDGPWANLLVMDMLAYFGTREENPLTTISEIWQDTVQMEGLWESFGCSPDDKTSNTGRTDVDAPLEAKEAFISYYLDLPKKENNPKVAGMEIAFLGGIRFDVAEMQLRDADGDDRYQLRVRASGTEPINRIYVESRDAQQGKVIMDAALAKLEELTIDEIRKAHSEWRLVDMLSQTRLTEKTRQAVLETIAGNNWEMAEVTAKLVKNMQVLEKRNHKIANKWLKAMLPHRF